VYSRITGYYRPIQNWNPGKLQEFTDRKTYKGVNFTEPEKAVNTDARAATINKANSAVGADKTLYLFTTKACPNCAMAKKILSEKNADYVPIDAEKHPDLVTRFDIRQAPTLAVVDGKGNMEMYTNVSNIIRYINRPTCFN
jgi:ribonucleoside-triphosphate reductase